LNLPEKRIKFYPLAEKDLIKRLMTTQNPSKRHRFSKFILGVVLTLGLGLGSAQALLSDQQAKDVAYLIQHAAFLNRDNVAFNLGQSLTQGTSPTEAAMNAVKLVKALPLSMQRLYAGRIGMGIAYNFPSQASDILLSLILTNSRISSNPGLLVQEMSGACTLDQIEQLGAVLSATMRKNERLTKLTSLLANSLMTAISNRTSDSPQARANALAAVASDLAAGVIGKGKHKTLSSSQMKQLKTIASLLGTYVKPIANSAPSNTAALVYQSVGLFAQSLKSLSNTVSSKSLSSMLGNTENMLQIYLPDSVSSVHQAYNDVHNDIPIGTGNVTPPETPV
jgi:hypothetical protein